ncbi:MAG TPA: aminotransferase class V-fold PLP-dependent enzyme [Gemmatimonadaceae bacterium]|nr:aminotransferase class V-fold PLP-dependent enzyme [Gemmatimonadaceae bacterium]
MSLLVPGSRVPTKQKMHAHDDSLLSFREEFPILAKTNYLVSNSLGPMPRTVPEKLAEYARDWGQMGVKAWNRGWWELPVEAGNEIAPLINAGSGEIVMMPNVTIAQTAVLSAIDFPKGRDTIVMTDLDFPSVRYAYAEMAQRLGARIVSVKSEDGIGIDIEKLLDAIDERTRLVAVSHVLFRSAYVMDVDVICRRAHEMGALVSLDSFHAVGIIPVDVKRSNVDFLTGGVLKWLCGGPGACFLYVSPQVRDRLKPALTGWQAHTRPFAFEESMEYASGAFRWLNGTPVIPALYIATEGTRIIRRAGIDAIRAKSLRLTSRLIELADARGYKVTAARDPQRRGGTVAVDVPHGYEVAQVLLSRDILVDYRVGAGIRIAPHFFTKDEEVEQVVDEIDRCIESGSWQRFTEKIAVVT